ncbi:MFS transporter [Paraburkholderia sediminicola]|uniref:MFS transporter n=1 Tax=Paraburkholderia sediminicola TaxID=458836 RepID=UPI0038BBEEFE
MKQRWFRLLPVMMMTLIIAFMDRTNIGFAIPSMGKELGLTASILGFASGVLFLGYGASQILGGWIADKGHGKALIAVLMVLWGTIEMAQGFVHNAQELVAVRFAIGVFEGGIFPTFLLFVRNWFAPSERARANGIWQLCYPFAAMASGPIAGYILKLGDWRTLFIVEGVFPLVWVFVWLWGVADSPRNAKWLKAADRAQLLERLDSEKKRHASQTPSPTPVSFGSQLRRPAVWLFATAILLWNTGFLGFVIWLPSVIHQQPGLSSTDIGWLSSIPYAFAIVLMPILTYWSDRKLDRRLFSAIPLAISGLALLVGGETFESNPFVGNMVLLVIAGATLYGSQPVLWSIATELVPPEVTARISGMINGIGMIGAFGGPYFVGYARSFTNSFSAGLLVMGLCLIGTSAFVMFIREAARPPHPRDATAEPNVGRT